METSLDFSEVAALINRSKTSTIDPNPEASGDGWSLHRGTHRLHTATYPFHVFNLTARATRESIELVSRKLRDFRQADVVFPPSLEKKFSDIRTHLRDARGAWTTKEYLASFIRDELGAYTTNLKKEAPRFYVDPFVTTPSGVDRKVPNPLKSLLLDDSFSAHTKGGALGIVLAEPGQGKTYMCRYLVSQVVNSKTNLVPLIIDSSQWAAMSVADQSSLWKTIAHTFRHFGATIGWLEGNEDQFLRTTLKADLFRIIFDGFDEYVLRNNGEVQPLDVLGALAQLATETGARIVITSRTSFWESNISEEDAAGFLKASGAFEFRIQPFDQNHAANYFAKRLPNEEKLAHRLWSSIRQQSADLAGRGFVLSLVADLVERGESLDEVTGANAILWLVNALCQREALRQQLPYNGPQQVRALASISLETARGRPVDDDALSLALAETQPELGIPGREILDKLISHPLISYAPDSGTWFFREDQIRIALIANEIVSYEGASLSGLVDRLKMDPAGRQDLAEMIVDIALAMRRTEDAEAFLTGLAGRLRPTGAKTAPAESQWLLSTILLQAIDRLARNASHSERTAELLKFLGRPEVSEMAFAGTIARFDFRGTTFSNCLFQQATWANCQFDGSTVFRKCTFVGGAEPRYSTGFGSVQFVDCLIDTDANNWINAVRVKEGKRQYGAEDLAADFQSVITKFVGRGGIGLRTVHSRHVRSGAFGSSKYRDEIMEALMANVLEEHHISGASGSGLNVRPEAEESVRFFTSNNTMTGPLKDAFERVRRKLRLSN